MLLKRGDNNENVKLLQIKLGLEPIGNFGPKTEDAVKAYQLKNGLSPDGVVGDTTWNKIMEVNVPKPVPEKKIPQQTQPKQNTQSTLSFDINKLKGHVPDVVIAQIPDTAKKFNINTPLRLAHFLAQCGHESAGFTATTENLNYSALGLKGTFKKYFPTDALANAYARQPEKIANRVYASRMGNGDEKSGDGYKYRGRGYIQLTGKQNYSTFSQSIGDPEVIANPTKVATNYQLLSAAWFFQRCLSKCDIGPSREVVTAVTKLVNGGTIGLEDRIKHFNEYYKLLTK
jgi:putative chitinase